MALNRNSPLFDDRWLALFVLARLLATATAVALLLVRPQHANDTLFAVVALAYGFTTIAVAVLVPAARRSPAAWAADVAGVLMLILLAGEWRSPFYLLALTALILPSTQLGFGPALLGGSLFTVGYVAIAFVTGLTLAGLDSTERLESLATHVLMPVLVSFLLAYATKLLRRLEGERERSERLAVETERRRIAWELHDSSKQRVHAAHLVLSQLPDRLEGNQRRAVEVALSELANATVDMDASLWELRAPLETERLEQRLRTRARELGEASGAAISVNGSAPALPGWISTHVYRIASEAVTNALRHSSPNRVEVMLSERDGVLDLTVSDDGTGRPKRTERRSNGMDSMNARASAIEGRLAIHDGPTGRGTLVRLQVPIGPGKGELSK